MNDAEHRASAHAPGRWDVHPAFRWHPTPKRIWIFCIAGAMELEASDGAVHPLERGSVMLWRTRSAEGTGAA